MPSVPHEDSALVASCQRGSARHYELPQIIPAQRSRASSSSARQGAHRGQLAAERRGGYRGAPQPCRRSFGDTATATRRHPGALRG
eukprot:11055312-Heterocapsa_arctica.AAC.1